MANILSMITFSIICLALFRYRWGRQYITNFLFLILIAAVYRAPWQSYPPAIASKALSSDAITDYREGSMQVTLFADSTWGQPKKIGQEVHKAQAITEFQAKNNNRLFSAVFETSLLITEPGKYQFKLEADDSAWLYIDDFLIGKVSNIGSGQHKTQMDLSEGMHPLKIYYQNLGGDAKFHLLYKPKNQPEWSTVPNEYLILPIGKNSPSQTKPSRWKSLVNH